MALSILKFTMTSSRLSTSMTQYSWRRSYQIQLRRQKKAMLSLTSPKMPQSLNTGLARVSWESPSHRKVTIELKVLMRRLISSSFAMTQDGMNDATRCSLAYPVGQIMLQLSQSNFKADLIVSWALESTMRATFRKKGS